METIIENEMNVGINSEYHQNAEDINNYDYENSFDKESINYESRTYLTYDEQTEINDEIAMMNYHSNKDSGKWLDAKTIISQYNQDDTKTEYLWDFLESRFTLNNDNFDNIIHIFYSNKLNNIVFKYSDTIAKYIVDNLKIKKFVPKGYIFSTSDKLNEWHFTITIITTIGIYSANRYVDENMIGWY
jgi:hypothetical protein